MPFWVNFNFQARGLIFFVCGSLGGGRKIIFKKNFLSEIHNDLKVKGQFFEGSQNIKILKKKSPKNGQKKIKNWRKIFIWPYRYNEQQLGN